MTSNPFIDIQDQISMLDAKISHLTSLLESSRPKNEFPNQMNIDQLMAYIGNPSRQTVYQWIFKKMIPHYKVGKRVYFNREEIEAWLSSRKKMTISERVEKAILKY